jgi:hypothetical protein
MTTPQQSPPGWYPDPSGNGQQRYWDGTQWTNNFAGGPTAAAPGFPAQAAAAQPGGPPPVPVWAVPVAVVLAIVGSVGPWVDVSVSVFGISQDESVNGLKGDGVITLIATLVAGGLLAGWFASRARGLAIGALVVSALGFLVAGYHAVDPTTSEDVPNIPGIDFSAGWGVWVATLGLLAMTVIAAIAVARGKRA